MGIHLSLYLCARSVSKARLTVYKTVLPTAEMKAIDAALASFTDLYGYYRNLEQKYKTSEKRSNSKEEKIRALRKSLQEIKKALPENIDEKILLEINKALNL